MCIDSGRIQRAAANASPTAVAVILVGLETAPAEKYAKAVAALAIKARAKALAGTQKLIGDELVPQPHGAKVWRATSAEP